MKKMFAMVVLMVCAAMSVQLHAPETEPFLLIGTDMGKIKVKLYTYTPEPRDNFIKQIK